ncbi:MAG: ATP-binding protein [Thermoanaerobaculia bacterium]
MSLSIEPVSRSLAEDDLSRARARPGTWVCALGLIALAIALRTPVLAVLGARLVLLLGSARSDGGLWEELFSQRVSGDRWHLGLVSTPADLFLTGLAALVILRVLAFSPERAVEEPPRSIPAFLRAVRIVLGLAISIVPLVLAVAAGYHRSDLLSEMSLVPASGAVFLGLTGAVALLASMVALAAGLLRIETSWTGRFFAPVGFLLLAGTLSSLGSWWAPAAAMLGSASLALWLSRRMKELPRLDLLGRAATAVFLVAAASVIGASGAAAGKLRRFDRALDRAEQAEGTKGERLRRWEERVADAALSPWLPAGERTVPSDLARALWVRGADAEFPGEGDVLTVRNPAGEVVSSFGVIRPGTEGRGRTTAARIPVPSFRASWKLIADPRGDDRDSLLTAVVAGDLPERVPVDRLEYDAAGRLTRPRAGDRFKLPDMLLTQARSRGTASGFANTATSSLRMHVRSVSGAFVAYTTPTESPLATLGAATAAAEAALLLVLPILLAGTTLFPAQLWLWLGRGRLLGSFRARLVALVFLFGALPLAGSVFLVQLALERHSGAETTRRARGILAEARRALPNVEGSLPDESDLNRAASVIGSDLLLYRDGRLLFASRALPVAAEIAEDLLTAPVAETLAEGRREAAAVSTRAHGGLPRMVEAAESVSRDGREALAVVVAEDEAGRLAVDSLVLFAFAVALGAFGLGGRAAISLSRPIEDLIEGAELIGSGRAAPPIERPSTVDLARLVDSFEAMASRVKERTESLARERAAAVGLLSNLTAAVILFRERDRAVLLANPTADQILPGRDLEQRTTPAAWAPLRDALDESRRGPSPHETRITVFDGGQQRVFRVVIATLPPDESEERSLLLLEDLTDFIRADRLTAWVDAARSIAHDVKNPLTPIRLSAERLLRFGARGLAAPEGALEQAAVNILRQVDILTERIGRLARFSDPSTVERLALDPIAVNELLTEVASDYAAHERISVDVNVAPDLGPLAADRALLRDALTNFLLNAVEAIGDAGGRIRLSAEPSVLEDGRTGVSFACEDDGPGVPDEQLGRLFDPTFSTKSRGSGMGLAAARRAVERQGGSVFAQPGRSGGLRIGFVIPTIA